MICDSIIHSHQYDVLSDRIADAFRWLRLTDFSNLADGRYELRGADLYIMLSTKQTKPVSEEKPEAHKKYLDIQYIVDGTECIGYCPIEQIEEITEERPDKDIAFFKGPMNYVNLSSGEFMLAFPQDVHAPGLTLGAVKTVRKAVVKIKI